MPDQPPVTAVDLVRDGPVATIKIKPFQKTQAEGAKTPGFVDVHTAIGLALDELRWDESVRIIVITGAEDGEFYWAPGPGYYDKAMLDRLNPMNQRPGPVSRRGAAGIMETLALIEKPVIARVNGHASSNGQSILYGCDLIVAWEDAIITENHLGMQDVTDEKGEPHGYPFGMTPGDGAGAMVPLFMPPTKAKEYLMLSPAWKARDLAAMNIVNYAVPMDQLDTVVNDLIAKLLRRPARTLARTKRMANKALIQQWNLAFDLSLDMEMLDFWELGRSNWENDTAVDWKPTKNS
ncbi:MAG: enoyl-CoA hydratase/isomerase family protein [Chloroflexi bacterium]|nr:enoyl-CoA hydratase/isomerase family protein [Chloroflexota bacterium]